MITNKNTKYSRFLKLIGAEMVKNAKKADLKNYVLADELAAACFIDNDIILESEEIVRCNSSSADVTLLLHGCHGNRHHGCCDGR